MILDGKLISEEAYTFLKPRISKLKNNDIHPKLVVILVGDRPESKIYVNMKSKKCNELGILCEIILKEETTNQKSIKDIIIEKNNDENVHGIMVQLPLPEHLDKDEILNCISPFKDVDGLTETSLGSLTKGTPLFSPCTPLGCIYLLKKYNIECKGKNVVVIGSSNLVGLPLSMMLIHHGATVTICNINTLNTKQHTQRADIVISCCGVPNLVKNDWIKYNSIVIDVGINKVDGKIVGDVDYEQVKDKCSYISPVPGGVGPMTIAMLIKQIVESAEMKHFNNL